MSSPASLMACVRAGSLATGVTVMATACSEVARRWTVENTAITDEWKYVTARSEQGPRAASRAYFKWRQRLRHHGARVSETMHVDHLLRNQYSEVGKQHVHQQG